MRAYCVQVNDLIGYKGVITFESDAHFPTNMYHFKDLYPLERLIVKQNVAERIASATTHPDFEK